MKPLTAEWVSKAEGDFATMERESRVADSPNLEGLCFHAQQCAEKYLKARLCSDDGASVIGIGCLKADRDQAVAKEGPERGAPLPNYP